MRDNFFKQIYFNRNYKFQKKIKFILRGAKILELERFMSLPNIVLVWLIEIYIIIFYENIILLFVITA